MPALLARISLSNTLLLPRWEQGLQNTIASEKPLELLIAFPGKYKRCCLTKPMTCFVGNTHQRQHDWHFHKHTYNGCHRHRRSRAKQGNATATASSKGCLIMPAGAAMSWVAAAAAGRIAMKKIRKVCNISGMAIKRIWTILLSTLKEKMIISSRPIMVILLNLGCAARSMPYLMLYHPDSGRNPGR